MKKLIVLFVALALVLASGCMFWIHDRADAGRRYDADKGGNYDKRADESHVSGKDNHQDDNNSGGQNGMHNGSGSNDYHNGQTQGDQGYNK